MRRAASGGTLGTEPPCATCSQPESIQIFLFFLDVFWCSIFLFSQDRNCCDSFCGDRFDLSEKRIFLSSSFLSKFFPRLNFWCEAKKYIYILNSFVLRDIKVYYKTTTKFSYFLFFPSSTQHALAVQTPPPFGTTAHTHPPHNTHSQCKNPSS